MNKFGGKVKTRQLSFFNDEDRTLYTAYYTLIEVNGTYMFLKSNDYVTGKVNADTRYKAKKLGLEFLARMKEQSHGN